MPPHQGAQFWKNAGKTEKTAFLYWKNSWEYWNLHPLPLMLEKRSDQFYSSYCLVKRGLPYPVCDITYVRAGKIRKSYISSNSWKGLALFLKMLPVSQESQYIEHKKIFCRNKKASHGWVQQTYKYRPNKSSNSMGNLNPAVSEV